MQYQIIKRELVDKRERIELRNAEAASTVTVEMPQKRSLTIPISTDTDIRATLKVEGYAAVFESPSQDLYGWEGDGFTEIIKRGAFRKVLSQKPDVVFNFNHDDSKILARTISGTLKLEEDPKGLKVEATLPATQLGKDIAELIYRGDLSSMSFCFSTGKDSYDITDDSVTRTVEEILDLYDVSIVTHPAYLDTTIDVVAVADEQTTGSDDLSRSVDKTTVNSSTKNKQLHAAIRQAKSLILVGERSINQKTY